MIPQARTQLHLLLLALFAASALCQSKQWTFAEVRSPLILHFRSFTDPGDVQIPSLTNLTWYPCYTVYFCSRLDIRISSYSSHDLVLNTSHWCRLIIATLSDSNPRFLS